MTAPEAADDRFRPDLEGLRAVAVALVVLFHAGVPGMGGGFVGVDVFFVLSGFLITGLVARELEATGTLGISAFYARRARRLLPAAALVLVVTLAASTLLLPPLRVPGVGWDALCAALYAGNVRFAVSATDYFRAEDLPSPLLHYWSLGVEEQFYLFWPALLLVAWRLAKRRARGILVSVGVVGAISLALSLVLTRVAAPWAFYSLPSRAWELALGAMLALAPSRLAGLPRALAGALGAAGLGMALLSAILIDGDTPFPGTAALAPALGAALVILAGRAQPAPWPARLLGIAPFRWVGRISYSLYLWHWPVLVLPAAVREGDVPPLGRAGLVALSVALAAASQRWVEDPIRHGGLARLPPRRTLLGAAVMTAAVVALAGAAAVAGDRAPWLPAGGGGASLAGVALRPPLAEAALDRPRVHADGCNDLLFDPAEGECAYAATGSSTTVVLFGDSHVAQWFPAVERHCLDRGWRLVSLTKSACHAVEAPIWHEQLKREFVECATWREMALARIERERPAFVVVSSSRQYRLVVDGRPIPPEEGLDRHAAGLALTVRRLRALGAEVIVLGDTPRPAVDVPTCLSRHLDDMATCQAARERCVEPARLAAERRVVEEEGGTYVDTTDWVCPTDPCPIVLGDVLVYRDASHVTATFAATLAPRFAEVLARP